MRRAVQESEVDQQRECDGACAWRIGNESAGPLKNLPSSMWHSTNQRHLLVNADWFQIRRV